jgi:hypothetical protein
MTEGERPPQPRFLRPLYAPIRTSISHLYALRAFSTLDERPVHPGATAMADVTYILIGIACLGVTILYTFACDRL